MSYTGSVPDTEPGREWLTEAVCRTRDIDPETFFPDNNATRIAQAKAICETCPVRQECLIDCMAHEGGRSAKSRWGVYAGLTPRQRERLYHRLRQRKVRAKDAA
ncbi:WhiB family transcriptional regulator [Streptomyces griseorubiginosus]|uniref:WhiB family transcriptional regulator n=1 Tax=Streptomyces griseorubiginosus TaxID=67304 RepID=UPI0036E93BA4